MIRNELILAGLIASALAMGTACKSDKAAEHGEPTAQAQTYPQTPPEDEGGTTLPPEDTGGAGEDIDRGSDIDQGPESAPETGGSGVLNPEDAGTGGTGDVVPGDADDSGTLNPENQGDTGDTGGAGFEGNEEFGGDSFPSDNRDGNRIRDDRQ